MNAPQTTYCNYQFLDEVITNRKSSRPHSIAYSILDVLSDIVIDLSKDDLLNKIKTNPIYNKLNKRVNRTISPKQDWISECDLTNIGDDMFFITPGYIKDHKELRKKYGCLIVASDSDIHILDKMNRVRPYSLIPSADMKAIIDEEVEDIKSWEEVIAQIPIQPVNSAIILDNFMFTDKFEQRKEFSLYPLLKLIIPANLAIPFHLTIFACNDKGTLTVELLSDIKSEIEGLGIDNLKVSIIAHTKKSTTHDREIITNYHYLYSGKGFSVIDEKGVQELAKGEVKSSFHSIDNMCGTNTNKHSHNIAIAWAKNIMSNLNNGMCFIVGDKENRLFK